MKILVDMNLSPRWVGVLRAAGYDAHHWSMIGAANAPDDVLFEHAARHDFVILTHDLDFGAILAGKRHAKPSVVQLRGPELRPESASRAVVVALRQAEAELLAGALVTLDTRRMRIRILPLA